MGRDGMSVAWLKTLGFVGFVPFDAVSRGVVPIGHGVYSVVRSDGLEPRFVVPGSGRRGTHYALEVLEDAWVQDAGVLYFGRAECRDGILERLVKYRRFGQGRNSGHRGGRAIWQLNDAESLAVCWRVSVGGDPKIEEGELIEAFKETNQGVRPFANRIEGQKDPS
jgi:hypothetical protein